MLRPGGGAVILDTDYGSLVGHSENAARMARVLTAWDAHFVHSDLPRKLSRELRAAGFGVSARLAIPQFNPEFQDNTYGKGMLEMMASFAVARGVPQSEAAAFIAYITALGRRALLASEPVFVRGGKNGALKSGSRGVRALGTTHRLVGDGRFNIRMLKRLRHGAAARRRIELDEDLMQANGLHVLAQSSHCGGGLPNASTAIETLAGACLGPVFSQLVHCLTLVILTFVLGKGNYCGIREIFL